MVKKVFLWRLPLVEASGRGAGRAHRPAVCGVAGDRGTLTSLA